MTPAEATCADCDHSFELGDDAEVVHCSAHQAYRAGSQPATCECFRPRRMLTESCVTELWRPQAG